MLYKHSHSTIFIFLQQTILFIILGYSFDDSDMIQVIGFSNLYFNCLLLSIAEDLVSGFDTLGSNSYGVKKYKLFILY